MKLKATYSNYILECGTDEAGRGCLAGPVTAAAVILPANFKCTELNDSKQLSAKMRSKLKSLIEENAICYSVTHVCEDEIDSLNILNASITAMQRSVLKLNPKPEFISVDGNTFKPLENIPHKTIIKGDGKYVNIAAASILAKTYRDLHMETLHKEYPMYNWKKNKGYPTKEHREAIKTFGPSKYHRKSFRLLPQQYKLDF